VCVCVQNETFIGINQNRPSINKNTCTVICIVRYRIETWAKIHRTFSQSDDFREIGEIIVVLLLALTCAICKERRFSQFYLPRLLVGVLLMRENLGHVPDISRTCPRSRNVTVIYLCVHYRADRPPVLTWCCNPCISLVTVVRTRAARCARRVTARESASSSLLISISSANI